VAIVAACVSLVGILLIVLPGGSSTQSPGRTSPSNGHSSSMQPGGGGTTLPDQAGYISRWRRSIIIDYTGVIFQQNGPVSAAGTDYSDLGYSGSSGWGGTETNLRLWLSAGAPGPVDCASKNSGGTGIGTQAKVGNQYCFLNNQSPNGPIVVSLKVTRIQTDNTTGITSVTLDSWAWAPQSRSNGPSSSVQPGGDGPTLPDQAGYISRWKGPINIDYTGVIFQQAGPVSAAGTDYSDLGYSGSSGWGGTETNLRLWLSSGTPNPMDCVSQDSGYTGIGTFAQLGDWYCFLNNQSPNGPIVVSLKVTRIQTDNTTGITTVTLDSWAWSPR
jgi:hypothetical protein